MIELNWTRPSMDGWQKQVMAIIGNLMLLCGRQVGKSEIIAKKIAEYLINHDNIKLMICSGVERQASGLYNKVLYYLENWKGIKEGKRGKYRVLYNKEVFKEQPLRTMFTLKNGSTLITEPIGTDGSGARQHTLNGIIFEEMQLIPEDAFAAITPMLLTTGGFIWMLGTAWATEGYVYERLSDPDFTVVRVNSEEIAELRPEPQRSIMLNHLESERKRLGEAMYAQEYLAIPSDRVRQIFPDSLIKRCMEAKRKSKDTRKESICGVDPAGLGEDEGSISIFEWDNETEKMLQTEHEITTKLMTTETTKRIVELNRKWNFRKIYVDDGGLGFGVFSELLAEDETKFITTPINNSSRPLDYKDKKRKRIMKEDLIFNLLTMMERGEIMLLDDPEIRESLKSYKFEYAKETKKLIISSNYNHPVQSIARCAWHAQSKDLKLSVHSIKI